MSEWLNPLIERGFLSQEMADLLGVGGPVVAILLVFSCVAVSLIVAKLLQLFLATWRTGGRVAESLELWRAGDVEGARSRLLSSRQPVPSMVVRAMEAVIRHGDGPLVREEVSRQASQQVASLKSYLKPLEVIATLSPLLGLLGTVMGMILAFQQMEAAGNQVDPSVLSGGIWQALLTTAAGLVVAIPVVMLHSFLERKSERIVDRMEDSLTAVFTGPLMASDLGAAAAGEQLPEHDHADRGGRRDHAA
ncbi:MotA/TolQ/ExbB proton channel family protein [Marinobacter goseongensis]|uniref:MotA/TolQ/ExbB proton channel family protein n=1 Tax=Marinobacter goseongensis TaxID=453838 RepID=UPI002004B10D|nr:MotA/TolQ/ExbB proton channel family protein [Marinobacter goseongensis]MCK7551964.1 MotA/TolQ/ExbB proton channel family protein [Marinobacter goseongensis]